MKSDGGVKEKKADEQSVQMGYGDKHQAEDRKAMIEDHKNSTCVVTLEQSEESERRAVG